MDAAHTAGIKPEIPIRCSGPPAALHQSDSHAICRCPGRPCNESRCIARRLPCVSRNLSSAAHGLLFCWPGCRSYAAPQAHRLAPEYFSGCTSSQITKRLLPRARRAAAHIPDCLIPVFPNPYQVLMGYTDLKKKSFKKRRKKSCRLISRGGSYPLVKLLQPSP